MKERRLQSAPNRWGPGRVHRYIYDRLNAIWYCSCVKPGEHIYGKEVDPSTPVTCRICDPTLRGSGAVRPTDPPSS
jgi:hypothetical protein